MARDLADTLEVARIPLYMERSNRPQTTGSDDKDTWFVNGMFEVVENKQTGKKHYYFQKRPGMTRSQIVAAIGEEGRGITHWRATSAYYEVFGDKIYKGVTDLGVTLTTTSGLVSWAESRQGAATKYLYMNDGARLYRIATDDTVTTITTIPANLGDLVYFDGYLCTLMADGQLRNSDLDDGTTWDNTKFIIPIMDFGTPIGMARQQDFLITFLDNSLQVYYDNANPAGSPFINEPRAMHAIGCNSRGSVASSESVTFWVGNSRAGGASVWKMSNAGTIEPVSTPAIERLLVLNAASGSTPKSIGNLVHISGHFLYILTLSNITKTIVYDIDLDIWYEFQGTEVSGEWPIVRFAYNSLSPNLVGISLADGGIWTMVFNSSAVWQDNSKNYTVYAQTSKFDFETVDKKFQRSLEVIGDQQTSTTPVGVWYTDDDYQNFIDSGDVDMADPHPYIASPSSFRRRAWRLIYTGANPLRLEAIQVKYRPGQK